jgi:hypothetical protein
MSDEPADAKPIVRLTRWAVGYSEVGRGKHRRHQASQWTIYGVDADGVERVYAQHTTEAEHDAWRATDPLWHEAQRAMFARLLTPKFGPNWWQCAARDVRVAPARVMDHTCPRAGHPEQEVHHGTAYHRHRDLYALRRPGGTRLPSAAARAVRAHPGAGADRPEGRRPHAGRQALRCVHRHPGGRARPGGGEPRGCAATRRCRGRSAAAPARTSPPSRPRSTPARPRTSPSWPRR